MVSRDGRSPDFVQSLERGLAVIGAFDAAHPRLTLADAAKRNGLTRATVRRSLHTLAALGYVVCADGKWFELTPKVLDLGYAYLSSLQVGDIAQPSMEALSERVEESVSAAVLDGTEIVYVARVPQGLRSIAAPLRDRNGRAIAAMNVSTTVSRVTKERLLGQFLPALIETAGHVSAQLAKR